MYILIRVKHYVSKSFDIFKHNKIHILQVCHFCFHSLFNTRCACLSNVTLKLRFIAIHLKNICQPLPMVNICLSSVSLHPLCHISFPLVVWFWLQLLFIPFPRPTTCLLLHLILPCCFFPHYIHLSSPLSSGFCHLSFLLFCPLGVYFVFPVQ